jgi:hypothetical protein
VHPSVLTVGVRIWQVSDLCFGDRISQKVRLRQLAAMRKRMKIMVHLWSNDCLSLF